jgi:hypothetical protein
MDETKFADLHVFSNSDHLHFLLDEFDVTKLSGKKPAKFLQSTKLEAIVVIFLDILMEVSGAMIERLKIFQVFCRCFKSQ